MNPDLSLLQALLVSFEAIGRLLLVALVGFWFVRRGYLSQEGLKGLTHLMIDVIVPSALCLSMIKGFNPDRMAQYSPLILFPTLWISATAVSVLLLYRFWRSDNPSADNAAAALAAVQNSFYIPLPIVASVVPPEYRVEAAVLVGVSVIPVSPLQWTLGTWLVMGEAAARTRDWRASLLATLNRPVLGVVGGALLALSPQVVSAARGEAESLLPLRMVLSAMELCGQAMGPMAMIVLGGLIAGCKWQRALSMRLVLPVVLARFLVVPGVIYLLLQSGFIPATPLIAFVLLLEAAAPSAMNLALAAKRYDGEWEILSAMLLVINVVGVFVLPIWMALGMRLHPL